MLRLTLDSAPDAPSRGLRALDRWLEGLDSGLADRVRIAAGEALGNAVEHGPGGAIDMRWQPSGQGGTLCVNDHGPADASRFHDARLPDNPLATTGRGLYILAEVADAVEATPAGLCMTFRRRATH